MQPRFEVVDRERAVAVEADQIVPIALVIAEKEVLQCFDPSSRQWRLASSIVGEAGWK